MVDSKLGRFASVLLVFGLGCSPVIAQAVPVTAPLRNKTADGREIVTGQAKTQGAAQKTVLKRCGRSLLYGGLKSACPGSADRIIATAKPLRTYPVGTKHVWHNRYPNDPVNKTIERVSAVCKETCIWAGRASTRTIIRDVELTRVAPAKPREIDAGIKVGGSKGGIATSGVLIERVRSYGWKQDTAQGKYANGDGFVINRGVHDVILRNSSGDDNADSGVDTKADLTTLDNVSASGNGHYGFRFWGEAHATTLTCRKNAWGCIEAEAGARVTVDRLVVVGGQELVTAKPGAEVTILSCDLTGWTGAEKVKGKGNIKFGVGC